MSKNSIHGDSSHVSKEAQQLSYYLDEKLKVGKADVVGALAVFPIFGPKSKIDYTSFVVARERGVKIKELEKGASVRDLVVENPTKQPVLLYEGEEVLGAQQNRTFDVTILVPAGAKLRVPVSCVEAGRWDSKQHGKDFQSAPQAAYPSLRKLKNTQVRTQMAMGLEARADQGAVWSSIAQDMNTHGLCSNTGAMHDIYQGKREELNKIAETIQLHQDQVGALVSISGKFVVLDYVSNPNVFSSLHGPLVQGYALDALKSEKKRHPSLKSAQAFLNLVTEITPTHSEALGLGDDLRFDEDGIAGSGLAWEKELIQLTVFREEKKEETIPGTPLPTTNSFIRRPSQRR